MDLSLPSSAGDGERAYLTGLRPSRIRAVQAARNGWTSVDLIDVDSGQAVALRGMLELFGIHGRRFAIGQARQLVRALGGEAGAPYVVVVCHGDDGRVVLPALGDELERFQPLHGSVGPDDCARSRGWRRARWSSARAATPGAPELAEAYFAAGAGAYVAPSGRRSATRARSRRCCCSTTSPRVARWTRRSPGCARTTASSRCGGSSGRDRFGCGESCRRSRSRSDQAGLVGEHDELDAVAQAELLEDVRDVRLHGGVGDDERRGDLGVREALGDEPEDLLLARGELVDALRRGR